MIEPKQEADDFHPYGEPGGNDHRVGDDEAERAALAAEVRRKEPTAAEVLASAREVVDSTMTVIDTTLAAKRAERDALDAEIAELVAAKEEWRPVYRRIVEGHRVTRRRASDEATDVDDG